MATLPNRQNFFGGEQGTPVIIMGAGDAAVGLVKELTRSHEWRVVGFLDESIMNSRNLSRAPASRGLSRRCFR